MATKRKYGYYIKGNNIAIIEEGMGAGVCSLSGYNTQSACEDAGGTWTENASGVNDGEYRSPIQTITGGLEIQYAYSPRYTVPPEILDSGTHATDNTFFINGWTVIHDSTTRKNYLAFLRTEEDGIAGWNNAPTEVSVDDNFVIRGSARWNGLHKAKSINEAGSTGGILVTYTEVSNSGGTYFKNTQTDFNGTDETVYDGGSGNHLADYFDAGSYIWITGATTGAQNNGLFSISSVTQSNTATSSKITLGTRYSVVQSDDSDTYATGLSNEYSAAANLNTEAMGSGVYMLKAYRDFCYMINDVNVLGGDSAETFELDINRYQANAVVYYLKAKLAEDAGDIEKREFFLREFKRQLEKGNSALKRGPYIIQGFKEMR